jgi:hypothetical protein
MTRRALLALIVFIAPGLRAQTAQSRSATYLFTSNVEDARALWINPAGMGVLPLATIYAELAADQGTGTTSDWSVRQFSFGLHSRNIGISYQHDRLVSGDGQGTWRVGAAFPMGRRAALGSAVTFTSPERQLVVGLRFSPARTIDVGAVVENIGRPTIDGVEQPVTGVGGLTWRLIGGRLGLHGDAYMSEKLQQSGYDHSYRAGADLILPGRQSVSFLTALDLQSNMHVTRWNIGLSIGFATQLLGVGTALPDQSTSARLQSFSLTGIARGTGGRKR